MVHHGQRPVIDGTSQRSPHTAETHRLAEGFNPSEGWLSGISDFIIFTRCRRTESTSSPSSRFCFSLRSAPLVDLWKRLEKISSSYSSANSLVAVYLSDPRVSKCFRAKEGSCTCHCCGLFVSIWICFRIHARILLPYGMVENNNSRCTCVPFY